MNDQNPETDRLHDKILSLKAELAQVRDLLRSENQRANDAIDREEAAEEAALEAEQQRDRLLAAPAAVPVPPPADQTARRAAVAAVLRPHTSLGGTPPRYELPLFDGATPSLPRISGWRPLDDVAAAVLAVLPEQTDRAAVLLWAHAALAEQAGRDQAALARVRRLHDALDAETALTSPDDEITRGAAARKIAAALDGWTDPAEPRRMAAEEQPAETQGLSVDPDAGCPHCPDGHQDPERGSQPWSAWVAHYRDGDGQPMQISVARSAGAHVAESDAQWVRERLNAPAREVLPLDHPMRRECRCSEAGVCQRCAERPSVAAARAAVGEQPETLPRRGDATEQWLKAQRDAAVDYPEAYQAADGLLDLYRLHADTGTPLGQHVCEARVVGDCECLEQPQTPEADRA